ncbi:MAG: hypothetical protein ACHP9X_02145, partial [Steroidobacterales bacterium]
MRGPDHSCTAGASAGPRWSPPRGTRRQPPGCSIQTRFACPGSQQLARSQTLYVCRACGGEAFKWQGQCAHCRQWDSLEAVTAVRGARERGSAAAT